MPVFVLQRLPVSLKRAPLVLIVCMALALFLQPVPAAAAQAQPQAVSRCGSTYVVRRGDTLAKIAARCGVSVRTLRALNGRAALYLRPGTVLRLTAAPTTKPGATPSPPNINSNSVQPPNHTPPETPHPTWDQTMAPPER